MLWFSFVKVEDLNKEFVVARLHDLSPKKHREQQGSQERAATVVIIRRRYVREDSEYGNGNGVCVEVADQLHSLHIRSKTMKKNKTYSQSSLAASIIHIPL